MHNFNSIKDNPQALLSLISKYAKIQLKNMFFVGYIQSIDPLTHSVILLVAQEDKSFKTILILGHAIIAVNEENPESDVKLPKMLKTLSTKSESECTERKNKLLKWFNLNLLNVTESEENILFGNVTILPPYNAADICTDNPIVAMQVRKVMEQMPDNFNLDVESL